MRQLIFFAILFLFIGASCNKEHLPEYYFRCKVDGKEYVPDNCTNCLQANLLQDTILIVRGNRSFETLGIGINDNQSIRTTSYVLNGVIGRRGDYKFSTTPSDRYFTDSARTGRLTVTALDKGQKIVEGTFNYDAYNQVQNKTVNVTEGKFRLQYKTY